MKAFFALIASKTLHSFSLYRAGLYIKFEINPPPPLDLYFGPNESFCNEELRAAGEKLSTFFVGRGGENSQIKTFNLNLQKKSHTT